MKTILPIAAAIAAIVAVSPESQAGIMKCKDANGLWHYGDRAAAACTKSRSKVIEFSAQSGAEKVMKGAPTKEELKQEQQQQEAAAEKKKAAEEQARQDKILRESYATEQDIVFERDRKLKELKDALESGKSTLESLRAVLDRSQKQADEEKSKGEVSASTRQTLERSRKQVDEHEAALRDQRQQLSDMRTKYDNILKRYRAMKQREMGGASAQAAPAH